MKKKFFNWLRFWSPVIIWSLVIFTFSSMPQIKTTQIYWGDFALKKTAHVVEFAVLATLFYRAAINRGADKRFAAKSAVLFCLAYGISDEFHQSFTPGREPHVRDVIFDTIGALLAVYFLWKLLPKAPKKLQNLAKSYQLI